MKFVFVSNYINHHQKPFCDAMYEKLGEDFTFVQTMPMEEERISMGWSTAFTELPYVRLLYEDSEAEQLIYDADCALFGWSEREDIAQKRLLSGKTTLRTSERLYRDGRYKAVSPRGLVAKYHEHIRFRKDPVYMLCAGAYTAADFALIHAYPGKCLKWGYFPPFRSYTDEELDSLKSRRPDEPVQIVWAGRFIPLKHAEYMIRLAADLKKENVPFHIHMIGSGEMEQELKSSAVNAGVDEFITWYGFLDPDSVRDVMEHAHIHLCTSNRLEGWGAVVNEGMNSGCIEIVSDRMGAVPFLIQNRVNGLTYSNDDYDELLSRVLEAAHGLTESDPVYTQMGKKAYMTIAEMWNADEAAERLIGMARELVRARENGETPDIRLPQSGPLSQAPLMKL